jgi:hypothetical protein
MLAFVWYHGLQKIGWSELLLPEIHTGSVVERTDSRPIYATAEGAAVDIESRLLLRGGSNL